MGWYYLISALTVVATGGAIFGLKNKSERFKGIMYKALSIFLGVIFLARYMGGEFVIRDAVGLNMYSPFGTSGVFYTGASTIILWFTFAAELALILYPFFKDRVKSLNIVIKYFAPLMTLLSVVTLWFVPIAMDGSVAKTFFWRDALYAFEIGLALAYSVIVLLKNVKDTERLKSVLTALLVLLGMLIATIPSWATQVLFGYTKNPIIAEDFSLAHRLILYGAIILPIIIHFIFRKYEYEQRRFALLYLSLATMVSYCFKHSYADFVDPASWPMHLCNTAMFIVPLCLAFKLDKVYYFTLFINVFGALLAMLMPDVGEGTNLLAYRSVNFWLNHYCAFFMPILMMSLRIFQRPKMKQFIWSLIAFAVYYVVILIMNAWLTGVGESADFFFVNSDFVASKLGKWAEDLRNITSSITVNGVVLTFYPVYQSLFFLVYVVLSLAMWFVYEQFFEITDLYAEISERNRKIKADRLALEIKLEGRSIKEPMNLDGTNKLVLKDFSKRYSTSDVYAVKDANLEIEGGQIFGFLGPNGAGKSTIIKSIVGIQTITSGSIEVCGYDVEKQSVQAKMQIGFVPDHYALYENLTGREYVNYIADLYHVSKEDRTRRIDSYVERFNLTTAFDNQMKTYSHGMKQKITIMSALVHNPKVWILDEPLTGLDPESIFQVKECMKHHAEKGNIVFFSSHIIDVVERICDKIAIIKKGNILCSKTVKEIEESGVKLEEFYMSMIGDPHHD